jgi:hypothetical protein
MSVRIVLATSLDWNKQATMDDITQRHHRQMIYPKLNTSFAKIEKGSLEHTRWQYVKREKHDRRQHLAEHNEGDGVEKIRLRCNREEYLEDLQEKSGCPRFWKNTSKFSLEKCGHRQFVVHLEEQLCYIHDRCTTRENVYVVQSFRNELAALELNLNKF